MKQIFSFAAAILFIACQNQPLSPDVISLTQPTPKTQLVSAAAPELCETSTEEKLDLVQELENKELPGVYHREKILRSEFDLNNTDNTFSCKSDLPTPEDAKVAQVSNPKTLNLGEPSAELILKAEKWKILTQRWDVQPSPLASLDPSRDTVSPSCESPTEWDIADMMMLARN